MKKVLIVLLLLVAGGGAFLSRPTKADFEAYILQRSGGSSNDLLGNWIGKLEAEKYLDECSVNNRFVCTIVRRNNHVAYIGAFSTWFPWTDDPYAALVEVQSQKPEK